MTDFYRPGSIDELHRALSDENYIADRSLATTVFLALNLEKPLFLEGEAGVGKTEVGTVLASVLGTELIRLQCYEGIDVNHAVYEWNYARQLLYLRSIDASIDREGVLRDIFGDDFLIRRPLLRAIDNDLPSPPVLLIDEIDRADAEFEAFLLEILSDFQISIPETGTVVAKVPPVVVITSNRTREIHDAVKRRCLYHWLNLPDVEKEFQIVTAKVPGLTEQLARHVAEFMAGLRELDLYKQPGVAETLDWARALLALSCPELDPKAVEATLSCLLKNQEDFQEVHKTGLEVLVSRARSG